MTLVDSSKYISWMRAGRSPVTMLAQSLRTRSLVSCGIIRIEVLRGIVRKKVHAELTALFDAIPQIAIDDGIVRDATETAWRLDRKGRVLPVTDLLIAACAQRVGAVIVTEDPHFKHIPGITVRTDMQ